jgi:hypothetical protein
MRERGYRWSVERLDDPELWSGHEQEHGAVALELYRIRRADPAGRARDS